MNHLAHIFLSFQEEKLLVGNFIADYIRNKEVDLLDEHIRKGVFLHRQIDTYTDNHPIVRQGVRRLYPDHGKYAAVVIDIYYDYLLANDWDSYCPIPLELFTPQIYKILLNYLDIMPGRLKEALPVMIEHDWLYNYRTRKGITRAFNGLKRRTSKPEQLDSVVDTLFSSLPELKKEFNQFFPEVIAYVKQLD